MLDDTNNHGGGGDGGGESLHQRTKKIAGEVGQLLGITLNAKGPTGEPMVCPHCFTLHILISNLTSMPEEERAPTFKLLMENIDVVGEAAGCQVECHVEETELTSKSMEDILRDFLDG